MPTVDERLQRLEDIEDIRRLKVRYAEACDGGFDPDEIIALFTDDGVWDAGEFGRFVGEEMRSYWQETARMTELAMHYMINHVVDLDANGVDATGRCYLLATASRDGVAYWMAVKYEERYRKVDGRWLFAEMRLLPAFMTPFGQSWASAVSGPQ
jgi:SnoaL-like domain